MLRRDASWVSYRDSLTEVASAIGKRMEGAGDEAVCRWAKGLAHARAVGDRRADLRLGLRS